MRKVASIPAPPPLMNPDLSRVEALFHEALQLPNLAERQAFLAEACAGDTNLWNQVWELLRAHSAAAGFLDETVQVGPLVPLPELPGEKPGDKIGRYKLLQIIGEGGFGVVWMAEQSESVKRRVALKITKLGMDTREVVARFEAERQALALMDHPNIAKVFDVGATPSGRPYFVMELVRGVPITKFCEEEKLPMAQRLALFVQVCHAIQHAHQKGIIHRDIKPSNILVTPGDDGQPLPKVIDFGIAKALDRTLTDKTLFTQFEQMIGTPAYMSPEQAGVGPLDIDTRSDVYALGVLLYEMLTGAPPFDPKELMNVGFEEMRRVIREVDPPKPSTCLGTLQQARLTSLAQSRHTEAPKLLSVMKGDLDWIVMMAMEKNRRRRYDTANELALDVGRYLRNEAIQARPPSAAYRIQKWVRRNKAAFTAGGVVVLALLVGIGVSSWQAVRATRAEVAALQAGRAADEQRATAVSERHKAETERQNAVVQRDLARDSENDAQNQRKAAETATLLAEKAQAETERNLYTSNMNLAQAAWEEGNIGRVREILEETRSYPDRGFEWYYWQRRTHLEIKSLVDDADWPTSISSVSYSRDGRQIITEHDIPSMQIFWDAETGRKLHTRLNRGGRTFSDDSRWSISREGEFTTQVTILHDEVSGRKPVTLRWPGSTSGVWFAFSPDATRIVAQGWDGMVRMWETESGRELLTIGHPKKGQVHSVIFSDDGKQLWIRLTDAIEVWHTKTLHKLRTLSVEQASHWAISPDNAKIVIDDFSSNTCKVIDANTGRKLITLSRHEKAITALDFSPDGKRIVTGSEDGTAIISDTDTGADLFTFQGHMTRITSVAFSPEGNRLVTGDSDGIAKIWDAEKGPDWPNGCSACTTDFSRIAEANADGSIEIFDVSSGRKLHTLKMGSSQMSSTQFSFDGRRILCESPDIGATVWDAETGRELQVFKDWGYGLQEGTLSPDGRWIVRRSYDLPISKVYDVKTGRELSSLTHDGTFVFYPNGQKVICESLNTTKIFDLESGREFSTLRQGADPFYPLKTPLFSPDATEIARGYRMWDTRSGHELFELRTLSTTCTAVAFSPDGRRLATVDGQVIELWDSQSGLNVLTLDQHTENVSMAFSANGRWIATGGKDGIGRVWDTDTGRELLTLKGHAGGILSLAFSSDGKRILTVSKDGSAKLWDGINGRELLTIKTADQSTAKVAFSTDDHMVVINRPEKPQFLVSASVNDVKAWRNEEQLHELSRSSQNFYSYNQSDRDQEIRKGEDVVAFYRNLHAAKDPDTLAAIRYLATMYNSVGRDDEALKLREEALDRSLEAYGQENVDTIAAMTELAECYKKAGRGEAAIKLGENVLALCRKVYAADVSYVLSAMESLAGTYSVFERRNEALKLAEEILALYRKNPSCGWGVGDPFQPPPRPISLAEVCALAGLLDEALALWKDSSMNTPQDLSAALKVAILQRWFGKDTEYLATCQRMLDLGAGTGDSISAYCVALACCLESSSDTKRIESSVKLARLAVELGKGNQVWMPKFKLVLGLAEYRQGNYLAANEEFDVVEKLSNRISFHAINAAGFFHAMSLFRQGKTADARRLFAKSETQMRNLPIHENLALANGATTNNIIVWLAYKEAKAMIQIETPSVGVDTKEK